MKSSILKINSMKSSSLRGIYLIPTFGNSLFVLTIIVLSMLFYSCSKDDENEPSNSSSIVGKWKVTNTSDDGLVYIIFTDNNYYHFLYLHEKNRHDAWGGVFIKTDNQLDLGEAAINYTLSDNNNTLTLDHPEFNVTCTRDNSGPEKDEWLIPIQVIQEVPLNIGSERVGDLAFDGNNIWIAYNDHNSNSQLIKLGSNGNMLNSISVNHEGGLTYGNGYLWAGDYDQIKQVNPSTGEIVGGHSLSNIPGFEPYLQQLGYEPGYIWVFSWNGDRLYKLNELSGDVIAQFDTEQLNGLSFANGILWVIDGDNLYSINTSTGNYIDSYEIEGDYYPDGLTYDGNNFWASEYNHSSNSSKIFKLEIQ